MIGCGPYLAHPDTPLGDPNHQALTPGENQVPNSEIMAYKVIALARLVCPHANIPSTTALATLNKTTGRELGLVRGANVVMPNLTPPKYRQLYEIYPDKACINETAEACHGCLAGRIHNIGRQIGTGRGDSPNYHPARRFPVALSISRRLEGTGSYHHVPTLLARHRMGVVGGDAFHLGTVRRFAVARIAGNHTIFIEKMQISLARTLLTARLHLSLHRSG